MKTMRNVLKFVTGFMVMACISTSSFGVESNYNPGGVSGQDFCDEIFRQIQGIIPHLQGDINPQTRQIKGGLHTIDSLASYNHISQHEYKSYKMKNGVIVIRFNDPDTVFNSGARKNMKAFADNNKYYIPQAKTLFPANWTQEKIADAIYSVVEDSFDEGEITLTPGGIFEDHIGKKTFTVTKNIEGVDITVAFGGGRMVSTYPIWMDDYLFESVDSFY